MLQFTGMYILYFLFCFWSRLNDFTDTGHGPRSYASTVEQPTDGKRFLTSIKFQLCQLINASFTALVLQLIVDELKSSLKCDVMRAKAYKRTSTCHDTTVEHLHKFNCNISFSKSLLHHIFASFLFC